MGLTVKDHGNLRVPDPGQAREHAPDPKAHFHQEIVAVAEELAETVAGIVRRGATPLVLGGDHSVAMGTLAGLARAGKRPGVIWMDAHPDINSPETTPSGNVHAAERSESAQPGRRRSVLEDRAGTPNALQCAYRISARLVTSMPAVWPSDFRTTRTSWRSAWL